MQIRQTCKKLHDLKKQRFALYRPQIGPVEESGPEFIFLDNISISILNNFIITSMKYNKIDP